MWILDGRVELYEVYHLPSQEKPTWNKLGHWEIETGLIQSRQNFSYRQRNLQNVTLCTATGQVNISWINYNRNIIIITPFKKFMKWKSLKLLVYCKPNILPESNFFPGNTPLIAAHRSLWILETATPYRLHLSRNLQFFKTHILKHLLLPPNPWNFFRFPFFFSQVRVLLQTTGCCNLFASILLKKESLVPNI